MSPSWYAGVFLPLELLRPILVSTLAHFESAYRSVPTRSLMRQAEVFTLSTPFPLTIRVRAEGMTALPHDPRPASSLKIIAPSSSAPALRSFILEVARRLPKPPWLMDEGQRRKARRTWMTFFLLSAIPAVRGTVSFLVFPISLFSILVNFLLIAAGLISFVITTILSHPRVVARILRLRWGRWIAGPEMAFLGWRAT